jgi:hypothetical protein
VVSELGKKAFDTGIPPETSRVGTVWRDFSVGRYKIDCIGLETSKNPGPFNTSLSGGEATRKLRRLAQNRSASQYCAFGISAWEF